MKKGNGSFRIGAGTVALALLLVGIVAGCSGPTTVDVGAQPQGYSVDMSMDPVTLNPPQLSTLNFAVTDSATGKPVTQFQPVDDVLLHNVVVSKDLGYFRHSYTKYLTVNKASVQTYFPSWGTYYTYSIFQPVSGTLQTYTATIQTGQPGEAADLSVDPTLRMQSNGQVPARDVGGSRVEMVTGSLKAGQPSQVLFRVLERGRPVAMVWPFLGAAGHLWVIQQDGGDFGHEAGVAELRQAPQAGAASGTPSPGALETASPGAAPEATMTVLPTQVFSGTEGGNTPVPGSTAVEGPPLGGSVSTSLVPTFGPQLSAAIATLTAVPAATLLPVQQTALSSILETPIVQPSVGYGPDVVFTHTFPRDGLYKMWFEFVYRGQQLTADFVVRVGK